MKKIALVLLIAMIVSLFGCSYFDGVFGDEDVYDDESADVENKEYEDESGEVEIPSDDEKEDNKEDEFEKDDTASEGGNDNSEELKKNATIADYMAYIAESEYVKDKSFIDFIINMDDREVGNIIYAGPDGDGDGSINSPMSIYDAIDEARAGDTVYLRGGEYIFTETIWISNSGRENAYITIKSYPGEKAILTTTPENVDKYDEGGEYLFFGIDEGTSYLIFEDLEIYGATDEYVGGFVCYGGGQNHLIFKNNKIHDLNTTKKKGGCNAFLFMGENEKSMNNIALINNECYDLTLGYSEAVSFAGNCEYCYVIGNKVYDCNNIGIDFYGNAGYCSTESLDRARYCVAAYNEVFNCNSPYADCAGIYIDGGSDCLVEGNLIYRCQYGIEIGSEELNEKYPVTNIIVRNNVCAENTVCTIRIGGYDKKSSGVVINCRVYNNSFINNNVDYEIIFSKVENITFANNIFVGKSDIVETEFDASYIKNIKFYSNCFGESIKSITIFDKDYSISQFNETYGSGNISKNTVVGSDYSVSEKIVGSPDFSPIFDFNLAYRENNYIGAVE